MKEKSQDWCAPLKTAFKLTHKHGDWTGLKGKLIRVKGHRSHRAERVKKNVWISLDLSDKGSLTGLKNVVYGKWDKSKSKKDFTRKLLLEICISILKESWAAGTQRRRRGGERPESLASELDLNLIKTHSTTKSQIQYNHMAPMVLKNVILHFLRVRWGNLLCLVSCTDWKHKDSS